MKKQLIFKILSVSFLFLMAGLKAQTSTENYVQSKTCLNGDCTQRSETVTYFDGLGRAKQIVGVKASPLGRDVVTHIEYDAFGRQIYDFLPVPQPGTLNGGIVPLSLANATQPNIYGQEKIFSEKILENSPLDRVLEQKHPGTAWNNKPVKYKYEANTGNEVKKFIASTSIITANNVSSTSISLSVASTNSGYYPPGVLYKNTVTDEDGIPVVQFENGRGQVVLVRRTDGTQNVDTYYVFNEYNQRAYVIPPKAVQQIEQGGNIVTPNIIADLCYQYNYDGQSREVEKKLPGKDWEYTVYDQQDRPVLTQDGILRTVNNNFGKRGWIFTKYDEYGRVVYTGFFANTATRFVMQKALNSMASNPFNNERKSSNPFNLQGIDVYYDKQAFPTGSMTLMSVNYYDTYPPEAPAVPQTVQGQYTLAQELGASDDASTKSLLTASYMKNIEDDRWTKTYNYYDSSGRQVAVNTNNHLEGYTNKEFKLDFAGKPEMIFTKHKRSSGDSDFKVNERFIYDDQKRLLKHYHSVDNLQEELLTENTYNELDQLANKKTGNNFGTPLQSIDYAYNIRGWLTNVNDPSNLPGKLFGYEIRYQNTHLPQYAKYNGNISEIEWRTMGTDDALRRYNYSYDPLNRMKAAYYTEPSASNPQNNLYNEEVSYDLNGNILTLKRNTKSQNITALNIDDLVYHYKGNKLFFVEDHAANVSGYSGGGNMISYDVNGNMTDHVDKAIDNISYNYLNLPKEVKFHGQNKLNFLYRADGTKMQKAFAYLQGGMIHNKNTDYLDGFQYEQEDGIGTPLLQFFPTSEGYYDFQKKRYIYNYEDHVGNIRLAYYRDVITNEVAIDRETNYYPFGLEYESYNGTQLPSYTYGFQGQEKQTETGWSSYKWRNSIPELGRFFNVDPLAEDYNTWSTYAFSGNRVVDARELEGLEPVSTKREQDLPGNEAEFAEFIGGGINSVRAAASNLFMRGYNEVATNEKNNKYEVGSDGRLTLVLGVPKETTNEKIVNSVLDLATIGMTAFGGPEGALTVQGGKIPALKAFESIKEFQKIEARAARLNKIGREGKDFTKAGKQTVIKKNEVKYGKVRCENCGIDTTPAEQSKKGIIPKKSERQVDHIKRKREGGRGNPDNGQVLCRGCNLDKH